MGKVLRRLLIDGQLVDPGRHYPSINPATGSVIEEAPDATVEHAESAIRAARHAFDDTDWSTNVAKRVQCLRQLHEALQRHREELGQLTIAECGHTPMLVAGPALDDPISVLGYYAELAEKFAFTEDLGEHESRGAMHRRSVEREPAGVVSAIVAYNYPMQLALAKLAPALAAGCTVVLKGAPQTPLLAVALGELIAAETDMPAGVVNVITSSEVAVGEVLTTHPDVDMITFTGSTPVGRQIMAAASPTVKRVFLELGGKSALILLDDADIEMPALIAAMSICSHAGQGCAITSRLLVPRSRHDEIVERVKAHLSNVKVGNPTEPGNYMGPLISQAQREKVDGMVQRAIEAGAQLAMGGHSIDGPGFFYAPTLLTNVDPDSEVAQDELFGPVLAVIAFDDDDDAVRIANNSIFGLSGGVYGADTDRAMAVARRIRTGTVGVNGGVWFAPDAPFGGYKQSGIGREMGAAGLAEFLETKTIAVPVG
ncbi:Acyl-CoA reductase or other NAD-dependent aldehyde dehydrogenase [Mycobacterium rhizamassiliense]|uniref:Acyl-CoA reductase or other NAD-dependent aldehyde dehydrogenase n=2 Tax=Mycobacterium rhizamassiliense TaxID=1841860 RepID=A0A2U3NX24_9MYCO|nr:Acyl-CoA reductase or other NAD-dependent aldehyde dehydrogenase [Mycobacterium rhizamassiliense]